MVAYLRWRTFNTAEWESLYGFQFARAMEHEAPKLVFRAACEYLSTSRLVRPGVVNVLEHVATARVRAREETSLNLALLLTGRVRADEIGWLSDQR
ncbi:DUF4158 domain-containing protein [Brevibacterium aurantiacum]|uniref:DUF4158 domain-containing protein n=1 Tax=Brevibacterium aurantiacum TaxID=273384 RepID=UPI001642E2CA|nr:DUF4158 domain-containing protein [Brevibacterium aurantiacum]